MGDVNVSSWFKDSTSLAPDQGGCWGSVHALLNAHVYHHRRAGCQSSHSGVRTTLPWPFTTGSLGERRGLPSTEHPFKLPCYSEGHIIPVLATAPIRAD